jgi:hypothetical protein
MMCPAVNGGALFFPGSQSVDRRELFGLLGVAGSGLVLGPEAQADGHGDTPAGHGFDAPVRLWTDDGDDKPTRRK